MQKACPLYPQERTFRGASGTSAKGHKRTLEQSFLSDYSITSFARMRIDWGMFNPRLAAVFRLSTTWNFVASSIGRSPGFAPLRILST